MSSSLRLNDTGDHVRATQHAINAFITANGLGIRPLDEDGKYGTKTKQAVRDIQRAFNKKAGPDISVDGVVGRDTRSLLGMSASDATPGSTARGLKAVDGHGVPSARRHRGAKVDDHPAIEDRSGRRQPAAEDTRRAATMRDNGPTELGPNIAADRAAIRAKNHTRVNTVVDGSHITPYKPDAYRYGTARTAEFVKRLAERYHAITGQNLRLGDISRLGGGSVPDHKAHKGGRNVDVDMAFNDGRTSAEPNREGQNASWRSPAYDRATTRKLIQLIHQLYPGSQILFNDPQLVREGLVRHYPNHDNHLHIQHLN